jgi:glutaredoxin
MGRAMLDPIRTGLHKVITSGLGDGFLPVRVPKVIARRVNTFLGSPICSADELAKRRAAEKRLHELKKSAPVVVIRRDPAPVTVYFEKDRNQRMLDRIEEALRAKNIAFTKLDVTGDEATMDFVMRTAKCEKDDLPIVFVASTPVGGYDQLVAWDVSGELGKAIFG